jgi:hypothetical protein
MRKANLFLALTCLLTGFHLCAPALAGHDKGGAPLKVVIAAGEGAGQLRKFAKYLEENYPVKCYFVEGEKSKADKDKKQSVTEFKGLEHLADADVIVSNLYRTWAPPDQLEQLKKAFLSKPVVGLRKASHGFQNWLEADKEVFGAKYKGHYGFEKNCFIEVVDKHKDHPFVRDLKVTIPGGGTYGYKEVADDVEPYQVGGEKGKPGDPQTWSRIVKERGNQRVFYTRYDPNDIQENSTVRDLVIRAIYWAAGREAPKLKS